MSIGSQLRAMRAAFVARAKACVGISTASNEVLPADALAYEQEFFDHGPTPVMRWPDEVVNVESRGLRSDRWLPTIDNAKHEYSTTASRREAQRKLDAKRMVHVSVPVTEQDQLAAGWFGDRVWNNRIRASGTTYYKSVVR